MHLNNKEDYSILIDAQEKRIAEQKYYDQTECNIVFNQHENKKPFSPASIQCLANYADKAIKRQRNLRKGIPSAK
jgi:hypothetical protein